MTREQFVERWVHEFGGMIADAATNTATGSARSLLLQQCFQKVRTHLGAIHDQLTVKPPLPVRNGSPERKANA